MVKDISFINSKIKSSRRAAEMRGRNAESVAADFYQRQDFVVLARRLRNAGGELDLVAASETVLAFIEVKARASLSAANEAVTRRQQRRLVAAAELAMADHPDWHRNETRFDVVLIVAGSVVPLVDAFRPDDPT